MVTAWKGPGIHPAHAIGTVGAMFGRDAVYCTDGGMTSLWAGLALPSTQPNSYHGILEFGMLGSGIPSAIGSKLGAPSREVVCVTGDGAAGFNAMELQVAAREGLKITYVVMAEA
jgi:acetolactate synthase-1/2/3 large subunit